MIKYIKDSLWVIPLFLILSLPILFVLDGGFYSVWDINIPPISPELQLEKYFFINSPSSMGGRNFNLTTYLPLIAETWFFSLFMPVNWANSTVFYLHYFLTGISMYILIRYLFDHQILNRKATVAAIIGGILAMFNEYWFLRAHYNFNIIFLTAFSPLVLMYLHKLCMQDGRVFVLRNIAYILFFSFFMVPALGNLPVTITFSFAMLIFLLAVAFLNKRKFSLVLARLVVLLILGMSMHSWWIYPSFLNSATVEALDRDGDYVSDTLASLRANASNDATMYNRVLTGKGYFIPANERNSLHQKFTEGSSLQNTIIIRLSSIALVISAFLIFVVPLNTKLRITLISLLLVLIVFVPILASSRAPFGWLIEYLAINFPFYVFRRPPTYMFIIHFLYAIFVAGFVYWLTSHNRISRIIKATLVTTILSVVFIINQPRMFSADSFMNLTRLEGGDRILNISTRFTIPKYVEDVANYINQHSGEFSVLILPVTGSLKAFDWANYDGGYFGFDPYTMLISKATNSDFSYRHQGLFAFNNLIEDSILTNNYQNLIYWLKVHNVKFVIVDLNTISIPGSNDIGPIRYISYMENFPFKDKLMIGDSLVYELDLESHLFNAIDKFRFVISGSNTDIINMVRNDNISRIDYNVDDSTKEYFAKNSSNDFSSIIINQVSKISPSEYDIDISPNVVNKAPAFLSSTFFYDNKWKATVDNKELFPVNINGFSGWVLTPEFLSGNKNLTVTIRYTSQDIFRALLYASLILFSLVCIIIVTLNKTVKKFKQRERKDD
jgi:hypothetical protein